MKTIKAIAVLITINLTTSYSSDWPEWGGDGHNNMASSSKGIPLEMEPGKRKKGTEEIDPVSYTHLTLPTNREV